MGAYHTVTYSRELLLLLRDGTKSLTESLILNVRHTLSTPFQVSAFQYNVFLWGRSRSEGAPEIWGEEECGFFL